jgi:UDP-glucose 4-epimerase
MRLLVTGGAGYIGSVVAAQLLEGGHDVTVLDDLSTGHEDAVPEGAKLARLSLLDAEDLASTLDEGYDGVLHFAAKSLVAESVGRPELYYRNNVCGTLNLLEAMRAGGVRRLVFSSTASVYGEPERTPVEETASTVPTNPYGNSKLAIDRMIADESAAHGLAAVSLRYFNVAGASGRYGERHTTETHLIPIVLQVAAGERESVQIYGNDYPTPDGTTVRDYIHVEDLGAAHLLALAAAEPSRHAIYNLGNGSGFSVREVLEVARGVTGHPIPAQDAPRRAGDPAVLVASSAKIREELGWRPAKAELESMVGDAWTWLREHGQPTA